MKALAFRPHHFLCTLCFQGKGYSPSFIRNYKAIAALLKEEKGDLTEIEVTAGIDSICSPCPNNLGNTCKTQAKITTLDKAHSDALGFAIGDKLTWGSAQQRIKERLDLATFDRICSTCGWKPLGLCENVLKDFLQETPPAPQIP